MKSQFEGVVFIPLEKRFDERGWLLELFRIDQLLPEHFPKMAYLSQTKPGVRRGPHEHQSQADFFCFVGPGDFELNLWKETDHFYEHEKYKVGESNPCAVIVPPGVIHGYKNISDSPGIVFNAPNQLYAGPGKTYKVDEIRHEENNTLSWD